MRRFFAIFTPIAILIFSVLIMLSGNFLKKPRGDLDNVPKHMNTVTSAVLSNDWTSARKNANKLDSAWKIVLKRVQYSGERNEINALGVSISRIKAAITAKDKNSCLIELGEAQRHWLNLGQ